MSNWRHKRFTGAAVIDPDRCLHIQPFAMDQSRFVSYVAAKEEFYVIKRWQQTFEKVPTMHFVLNINQSITLIVIRSCRRFPVQSCEWTAITAAPSASGTSTLLNW